MTDENQSQTDGRKEVKNTSTSIPANRRTLLRMSGALAGGGVVGIGSVGSASASSHCTGSGNYSEQYDRAFYTWDDASADNYDCENGLPDFYKVEHCASIIYLGSGEQQNRWIHDFIVTGHAEHFTRSYCGDSWSRSTGIPQHRASFDANDSISNFDSRANEWVKAHPDISNQGSIPSKWMDWAFTGMSIAIGIKSWPAGSAVALTAVYLDLLDTTLSTSYDLTYDWEVASQGANADPCSSHFVWQDVQSDPGADDGFDFDYVDEAWGRYPNYTQIQFNIEFDDAITSNIESSSVGPSAGEVITSSKNERIKVKNVSTEVVSQSGKAAREVVRSSLTPGLQRKMEGEDPVRFKEFPIQVEKTTIEGKILD